MILQNTYKLIPCYLLFAAALAFPQHIHAFAVDVQINEKNLEVLGGDRLFFDVNLSYPENTLRKLIDTEYAILENELPIATANGVRSIETETSFSDYMIVPKRAESGTHQFSVLAGDNLYSEVSSATFTIYRGADKIMIFFYVVLLTLLFIAALVVYQIKIMRKLAVEGSVA